MKRYMGGFFYLDKQKSNKNAKNLGITVTTNTDKKTAK